MEIDLNNHEALDITLQRLVYKEKNPKKDKFMLNAKVHPIIGYNLIDFTIVEETIEGLVSNLLSKGVKIKDIKDTKSIVSARKPLYDQDDRYEISYATPKELEEFEKDYETRSSIK